MRDGRRAREQLALREQDKADDACQERARGLAGRSPGAMEAGSDFDEDDMENIRQAHNMSSYGESDNSLDKYAQVAAQGSPGQI